MKVDSLNFEVEPSDYIDLYGGEYWDGDLEFASYGLQFGDITLHDINPTQFKQLAISMMNHLFTNGYDFAIDRDHNGYFIKEITITR
jgi:hypothetical protein